jgi:hypothetical protein
MGESIAESVLREEEINNDVKRMKRERHLRKPQRKKRPQKITFANNVIEVNLHTDYSLYANPDKYPTSHPVPVIYDTGAAISMLSSEPSWTWTNLRDCMFNLGGCFTGPTVQNL